MTVLNTEVATPQLNIQEKVDANLSQKNVDANLAQKNSQNLQENTQQNKQEGDEGDANFKAFREARKKDRAEKQAAEKRAAEKEAEVNALKAAMEAAFSKSAPSTQAYQQYYDMNQPEYQEETEEQKIERKVNEIIAKKEQEYARSQQEIETKEWPNRIKRDLPDIWHVCSQENLDYLDYHYPELSRPLQRLSEGYDKWHDIYHAVKKFIPNHSDAKKDSARAESNFSKPKSISSMGLTQAGQAQGSARLTEERKAANWQRMQSMLKGIG